MKRKKGLAGEAQRASWEVERIATMQTELGVAVVAAALTVLHMNWGGMTYWGPLAPGDLDDPEGVNLRDRPRLDRHELQSLNGQGQVISSACGSLAQRFYASDICTESFKKTDSKNHKILKTNL